ncbi:MAG: uracil-DNA glycosylase [Proteobacteria bacterium]|nr:uracil-DNA glycosylase [Cystobacterineae bacterium]MCL2259384.1 uracil-DNA glycosylase [Cystobacterineae bacterium]MCL2314163.1 uracil-DNA glycosylase [Pseudomonadota bacterium]
MSETRQSNENQPNEAAGVARELYRYLQWHRDTGTQALLQSHAQPAPEETSGPPPSLRAPASLEEIRAQMGDCRRCKLCEQRTQIVFGVGNPQAELVFVGEGPGADEDVQGIPFVGRAGQLLTKMIEAMHFSRNEVYICNVVKCRPPNNRNPEPDEIEACQGFLKAQLAAIGPKVLVALGKFAVHTLLAESTPITKLRGRWREYEGIPLMPTYHPAYLLRNPAEKKNVWLDLQSVMQRLGKPPK